MPRATKAIVIVPFATHVEPACDRGLRALEQQHGLEVRRIASGAHAIDRARSDAAHAALRDGADTIVWIDSDIAFEPDAALRLLAHDLPIVGGVYAKKGVRDLALHAAPGTTELVLGTGGYLVDVRYVGLGFLATQRLVYDDVRRTAALPTYGADGATPYFLPMVVPDDGGGYWYLGEDYAFCERARRAGHAITVDTTLRLGHVGSYTYGWEDAGTAVARAATVRFSFPGDQTKKSG